MKTDQELYQAYDQLWKDIQGPEKYPHVRPYLAHYTSNDKDLGG